MQQDDDLVPQASEELGTAVRPALPGASPLAAEGEANPSAAAHDWFVAPSFGDVTVARITKETPARFYFMGRSSRRRDREEFIEKRRVLAHHISQKAAEKVGLAYAVAREQERNARADHNRVLDVIRAERDAKVALILARRDDATSEPPAASIEDAGRAGRTEVQT